MSLFMSNYSIYNPRLVPHLETGSHDSFTDSAGCVLNYSLSLPSPCEESILFLSNLMQIFGEYDGN